ncbi:glycosyltransferase [Streptomyces libani]|uniref:glycosyltransferase n=1 Tax=Streptomyces nigrescens TaxID=1920 RepID=UPI0038271633
MTTPPTAGTLRAPYPTALAVVVPAHNEAQELPGALDAVRTAARHPALADLPVVTVVVADACTDATPAVAAQRGAAVIELPDRNVGAARAAGVAHALHLLRPHGERTWIVTTDADSRVPPHWLAHQLHHARQGWHCIVGTVRLAHRPVLPVTTVARHNAHYFAGRPSWPLLWRHPHVHGANLGIAAGPYRAAGGFPALTHGEDRALVAALERRGCPILRTDECPVRTSGRPDPRAPHGFGTFLRQLSLGLDLDFDRDLAAPVVVPGDRSGDLRP